VNLPSTNPDTPKSPAPAIRKRAAQGTSVLVRRAGDRVFRSVCQLGGLTVILLAVLLVIILVWKSWLAITTVGIHFLTDLTWDPEPDHRLFGAQAFVYGTVATSFIAMLIAVPLGIGTAAFLSEIASRWVKRTGSFLVEMLAAIPSVVYGFWGLFVLVPVLQRIVTALGGPNIGGVGILPAGLILSIMIVPYIAAVSYDVCQAVPRSQREAARALGANSWQTIWRVVLPYASPGIIGGCFLALGRALGETMAVTMLIGNRTVISLSPFAQGNSIASVIANEFTEATYDLHLSALVELGLLLLLVSVVLNSVAHLLIRSMSRRGAGRGDTVRIQSSLEADERPGLLPKDLRRPAERRRKAVPGSRAAHVTNRVMLGLLGLCVVLTIAPLGLILVHLIYHGISSLNWQFFLNLPAPVGQEGGGLANALYGSAMLVGLATLFAVPIGLLAAIYLVEYRSDRMGSAVRFIGELLGGVPSIVIGIFAYNLLVKPMGHFSGWAGSFALGVMMIPIVMRASEEALRLVPQTIRNASHALGANHYQTVLRICVPAALPAIITGVFLAIARVGGETAPLLLTASENMYWPRSPNDLTPSLPVNIFKYAESPYEDWHRQAWAGALVLLVAVMLLNFGIRAATGKRIISASRAD
jgi:phosphate transport system permease protein